MTEASPRGSARPAARPISMLPLGTVSRHVHWPRNAGDVLVIFTRRLGTSGLVTGR